MKEKEIIFGSEVKKKLLEGAEIVYKAVACTLGPSGKNVIYENENGIPVSTKDGVTVAKEIKHSDPFINQGVELLKMAANKTNEIAGDGTTTTTILAYSLIEKGFKLIDSKYNSVLIKNGIDEGVKYVTAKLKENSKVIESDEDIKKIATQSSNNDIEIGKLISAAIKKVGKDGVVTVEESKTAESSIEIVEGLQFDNGYLSPYFVTNNQTFEVVYEQPLFLLYDKTINNLKSIVPFMEYCASNNRPLVILCEDVIDQALAGLVMNKARGVLQVCAIKAPGFGTKRVEFLEDVAVLTGSTLISSDKGMKIENSSTDYMGTCRKFKCTARKSTIIDGAGDSEKIKERIENIKEQLNAAEVGSYDFKNIQNRLSKLSENVAIIQIGADTELQLKEKKDRVDDSLHATKCSISDGFVRGSGVELMNIATEFNPKKDMPKTLCEDEKIGFNLLIDSIKLPFYKIYENAGLDGKEHYLNFKGKKDGFDVRTKEYVNLYEKGIIDPTLVVQTALSKAASVAGICLLTECLVVNKKEEKESDNNYMYE